MGRTGEDRWCGRGGGGGRRRGVERTRVGDGGGRRGNAGADMGDTRPDGGERGGERGERTWGKRGRNCDHIFFGSRNIIAYSCRGLYYLSMDTKNSFFGLHMKF